jgi:hypothetical protein
MPTDDEASVSREVPPRCLLDAHGHRWMTRKAAKPDSIGDHAGRSHGCDREEENPTLRGVLPKRRARRELPPAVLGG